MDELLAIVAELVGEGFDDAARERIANAAQKALDAGASSASDAARVEAKRLEADLRKAQKALERAEAKLADAGGETDARLVELRSQLDDAKATIGTLEAEAKRQKVRRRFGRALGKADVPEAKREAAIKLANLDEVEIDDKADDGLAGSSSAIERLRAEYGFLWSADDGDSGGGEGDRAQGGGPRKGSTPTPRPPKPKGDKVDAEKLGAVAVADALRARGKSVRGAFGARDSAAGA
jgi:hypothetical protein